jgi:hypothetical protein
MSKDVLLGEANITHKVETASYLVRYYVLHIIN